MFNFINNLLKTPHRIHPSTKLESIKTEPIISYLSNGNVLLQQAKYTTEKDIQNMKSDIFSYFSK
ncbi:MAG: hypothetical protein U9Q04_01600 [Campylobacterota bacterium]|nr:hypothetical protein [Campylobacterota bacterium]